MKVPHDIESMIELTIMLSDESPSPIATPIGVERANENRSRSAFLNVKPDLTNVPPKETEATKLCIPIVTNKKVVVVKSFWIPRAIPSKIE
jgi:hypothetical protein